VVDVDLAELAAAGLTGALDPDAAPPPAATSTQRVTVVMDDGSTYDATLDARDRRAYALNADRYGLPPFTMSGDLTSVDVLRLELLTMFSAWNATRHRLQLHGLDWPSFNARAVELITHPDAPGVSQHPPERGAA